MTILRQLRASARGGHAEAVVSCAELCHSGLNGCLRRLTDSFRISLLASTTPNILPAFNFSAASTMNLATNSGGLA